MARLPRFPRIPDIPEPQSPQPSQRLRLIANTSIALIGQRISKISILLILSMMCLKEKMAQQVAIVAPIIDFHQSSHFVHCCDYHGGRPSGLGYPSNPDILLVRRSRLSHDQLYLLQFIHRSQFADWFHLFFAAHRSDGRGVQPRYDHIFQLIIGKLILAIGRQQLH